MHRRHGEHLLGEPESGGRYWSIRWFVGVPEQGGQDMISTDPLSPGSIYTASVDDQGKVGMYRLEVGMSPGTGKLKIAGGVEGTMKESIQRAFAYLLGQKVPMGIGHHG